VERESIRVFRRLPGCRRWFGARDRTILVQAEVAEPDRVHPLQGAPDRLDHGGRRLVPDLGEQLYQQALAFGGVEALLSGLHPKARYEGGKLELEKTYEAVIEPAGRGTTLVPCVFAWPKVDVLVQPGYQPTLAYGPRRVASLWTSSSPPPDGTALEVALGTGRASVLKNLLVPTTTSELARQLRLSPAAVSAHLSRLKAAGLVEPHRDGKRVYYRLSCVGESLLKLFGETG
jgi:DNA-binding transcriptional ArsR family regulator